MDFPRNDCALGGDEVRMYFEATQSLIRHGSGAFCISIAILAIVSFRWVGTFSGSRMDNGSIRRNLTTEAHSPNNPTGI